MRVKSIEGMPVIDGKRPLKLKITANDCRKGDPKDPSSCAIARACRRELHVAEARVHLSRVYIRATGAKSWTRYNTPAALRQEIIAFDRGGSFAPGEHIIPIVIPSKKLTGKRQGGPGGGKKSAHPRKRRAYHKVADVRGGPA